MYTAVPEFIGLAQLLFRVIDCVEIYILLPRYCTLRLIITLFQDLHCARTHKEVLCLRLSTPKQFSDRFERIDPVTDNFGDGDQWRTEQQAPDAPQPAEEQQ